MAQAVLRPVKEDEQQIMGFYLPAEEDISRLDDVALQAVDEAQMKNLEPLWAADGANPEIDKVFPVSYINQPLLTSRAFIMNEYAHMTW